MLSRALFSSKPWTLLHHPSTTTRFLSFTSHIQPTKGALSLFREDGWKGEWTLDWLQDNCRCSICFEASTQQRLTDTCNLSPSSNFERAEVIGKDNEEELLVYGNDQHTLKIPLSILCTEEVSSSPPSPLSTAVWKPFTASSSHEWATPVASAKDILAGDKNARKAWAKAVWERGFAIVDGLDEGTEVQLRQTVEGLVDGPPQYSMFGETWDIPQLDVTSVQEDNTNNNNNNNTSSYEIEHLDTAYINIALEAHTDGCYSAAPPGIQFFQIPLRATKGGGENFLVDGLAVAQKMRTLFPDHFETLCDVEVPYRYFDGAQGLEMQASWPVFRCDAESGRLLEFHWNNSDRAPLPHFLKVGDQKRFLEAVKALLGVIREPEMTLEIPLEEGWLLGVNNWRVMHGRREFHGERRLMGAYVTRDLFDVCRSRLL